METAEVASHLLLIAREAVTNAVKHANPTCITISLTERAGRGALAIRDDGVGFCRKRKGIGLGLSTMRSRADLIGADLDIRAGKTCGTVVTCSWQHMTSEGPQ